MQAAAQGANCNMTWVYDTLPLLIPRKLVAAPRVSTALYSGVFCTPSVLSSVVPKPVAAPLSPVLRASVRKFDEP